MSKCKDIPDIPILEFLARNTTVFHTWRDWGERDVKRAMPAGTPEKLALAKMRQLIKRKLVNGCACGCRGDFHIAPCGIAYLHHKGEIR
jgi:hypothetical protein